MVPSSSSVELRTSVVKGAMIVLKKYRGCLNDQIKIVCVVCKLERCSTRLIEIEHDLLYFHVMKPNLVESTCPGMIVSLIGDPTRPACFFLQKMRGFAINTEVLP